MVTVLLPLAGKTRKLFSYKTHKEVLGLPYDWSPVEFWLLDLYALSSQQFVSLNFHALVLVSGDASAYGFLLLSCDSVYPPVGVSDFGSSSLPCDLTFEAGKKSC